MVIILASTVMVEGLTFTVGQITWTTLGGGPTTMTSEETQIQSRTTDASTSITSTLRTRPPLPRYRAKQVDNSDLLQALDRVDHQLLEASNLVNSISRRSDQAATINFCNSRRSTRVSTHEHLETSLTITSTTEGRTVKLKTSPLDQHCLYSLSNAADQFSRHTQSLFRKAGFSSSQNRQTAHHFVNMVSICTLPEDKSSSTSSSIGSVPTEVLHPEDEDYDLDLPPYPPGVTSLMLRLLKTDHVIISIVKHNC